MTSSQTVWITPKAHERLQEELATLQELCDEVADEEGSDENTAAVQRARRARIQQIHDLLVNAVVGEDPPNDGIAEPGMVVTVRFDDDEDTETFLLGVRGAEHAEIEVYSVQSPLGSAIIGARPGEQRTYTLPSGATATVTLLKAVPYGMHAATELTADAT
ncbi:GreA/GreB family elongation factor [Mycolicibacterium holsaticum]|uniref:GreA/GreB family elongation factor n=1 Tax=Mycolicibacterium holsaticum TaxID=152142 RepID=UPI001C7CB537|nr:GreA/GreB family elongation factor [Mycolicibacterium holsaticum]MDA4107502.1 elongation factor GreAB [Mycolicibacterium holsaticum DSM 44478 = JCM 12374]QZA11170.1 GreA/GreB family elongation factor [Mycolicibacterium holsaticum DSM 44478 = JCM 12374]UNC11336.1 GreA/GreB family elongation factor [Mycolicibacterium holsaticum DSM 44478 = JCM 12374]